MQDYKFGLMIENAPAVITVIDPNGMILYLNRTEFELDKSIFTGKAIFDFIDPSDHRIVREAIRKAAGTGEPQVYVNASKTGERLSWYENQVSLLDPGSPEGDLVIFSTNITECRQADDSLKESEARYQQLVEQSPDTIVIHCEGKIAYINQAGLEMLGAARAEEILGRSAIEFVHPEDRARVGSRIAEAMEKQTIALPMRERFLLPSGKVMPVEVKGIPHVFKGKPAMQVIIRDVTEQVEAEKALKSSEARLAAFLEYAPALIMIKDHELRPVFANQKLYRFFPVEAWMGKTPHETFPPEVAELMIEKDNEAMTTGHTTYEEIWKDKQGESHTYLTEKFRIDIPGGLPLLGSIISDISDKKQAETEFRMREHQQSLILNSLPVIFYRVEPHGNFRTTWISDQITHITGYKPEAFTLNPVFWEMHLHPEDHERILAEYNEVLHTNAVTVEYRWQCADGSYRWFLDHLAIIRDEAGNPVDSAGIWVDITKNKQVEEELIKARQKAEESDRLKSSFLANMSHEIRTPMNAIVGFAQMLTDPWLSAEERVRFSTIVQNRSDDLMHIINDLLEISRIESGNTTVIRERIVMNDLIDEMETVFNQKLKRAGKQQISLLISKTLSVTQSAFVTDGYIVRQVFTNLLDNAIKYTLKGEIRFGYDLPKDGKITCYVSDTGIGISAENQEVIFEHFRQADIENQHQYGGTGLGLSICKGVLSLLGGTIEVESGPGKGSHFRFTIPFEQPLEPETETGSKLSEKKTEFNEAWKGKKLLLVEDEPSNMEYLTIILSRTGAELVSAYSGKDLRDQYPVLDSFDLVLLDVQLPDASGWDLVKEIKAKRPDLPVIAQTAFAMSSDRKKSEETGCDNYIPKPIYKEKLLRMIADYL